MDREREREVIVSEYEKVEDEDDKRHGPSELAGQARRSARGEISRLGGGVWG